MKQQRQRWNIFMLNELRTLEVIEIMELFMSRNHHHHAYIASYILWMKKKKTFINQIFSCIRYVLGSFDRRTQCIINIVIYSLRARSCNYQECAWKCGEWKRQREGKILRNCANVYTTKHNNLTVWVCVSCSNELNKDSAHLNVTLICYQLHSTVRLFVFLLFLLYSFVCGDFSSFTSFDMHY